MTPPWRPPGADPATFEALVEGVPAYMLKPLVAWLRRVLEDGMQRVLQSYDTATRRPSPLAISAASGMSALWQELTDSDELFTFIDYLVYLSTVSPLVGRHQAYLLEQVLADNGSAWKVGVRDGEAGLEKRVPEGVALAAEAAMAEPGHAGRLLSEAWHAAFGREPDYEKAYSKAVKSVEAAALPVICPTSTRATLGTALSQMRAQNDWAYPTDKQHGEATPSSVLLGMMQSLWTGQNDRHAGQSDYAPTSRDSAEAAVILSVSLVQWFTSGAILRR